MIPSSADATAAARRIQEGTHGAAVFAPYEQDADLLAGFVLAGDTERLREAGPHLRFNRAEVFFYAAFALVGGLLALWDWNIGAYFGLTLACVLLIRTLEHFTGREMWPR